MNLRLVRWIDIFIGIPLAHLFYFCQLFSRLFTSRQACSPIPRNILLVKFWGIGNILMLLPTAASLRKTYPESRIDLLTLDINFEAAASANLFQQIHTLSNRNLIDFSGTLLHALWTVRRSRYDLVIDFEQFARFSTLFCTLIEAPRLIGFFTTGQHREFLYSTIVPYNNSQHMTRSFHQLAEAAGVPAPESIQPVPLVFSPLEIETFNNSLASRNIVPSDSLVIFHVGTSANFSLRRWPVERFIQLGRRLLDTTSVKIALSGQEHEAKLGQAIFSGLNQPSRVIDLCGKLRFNELGILMEKAAVILSADTAPVHLASALNRPIIGLYGPNTPELYGPWGDHAFAVYHPGRCSPCITNYNAKISHCRHPEGAGACMRSISVDEVASLLESILAASGACAAGNLS